MKPKTKDTYLAKFSGSAFGTTGPRMVSLSFIYPSVLYIRINENKANLITFLCH